jgi:hypothetical protein
VTRMRMVAAVKGKGAGLASLAWAYAAPAS